MQTVCQRCAFLALPLILPLQGVFEHGNGSKWSVVFRPKEETTKEKSERNMVKSGSKT